MLGKFFAASEGEIGLPLAEQGPVGRGSVEAKGLDEVSLATLGEILNVGTYDDLVDRIADAPLAENGECGLLRVPDELRDAVASGMPLDDTAQRWAATEELTLGGWSREDALGVLRDLVPLAQDAKSTGQQLLYWWSL